MTAEILDFTARPDRVAPATIGAAPATVGHRRPARLLWATTLSASAAAPVAMDRRRVMV